VQIQQAESDHPSIFPAAGRDGIFTFWHSRDACANCASTSFLLIRLILLWYRANCVLLTLSLV
jgi:hypothetical protein